MNRLDLNRTASRTGLPVALLNEIVSSIRNHAKVERIVLFGSRAGERWNVRSDIDIAVLPESGSSFYSNVVEEEIRTLLKIDLLDFRQLNEDFTSEVLRNGIVLYEAA